MAIPGGTKIKGRKLKVKGKTKAAAKRKPLRPKQSPLDDPNALNQPLTPRSLNEQVAAQTALYAGPAAQELAGQRAVHNQMSANIPAWYGAYIQARQGAMAATAGAYGAAMGVQQNVANSTSALDAQQRAQQDAEMQASAQQRGQTVDPRIAAEAQQAGMSRRAAIDAQTGLTAGLGASEVSYRANQVGVGVGQGINAMQAEATRGRNLDASGSKLAAQAGQFATTARQKLIDNEHTKQLERKAFGLNQQKAAIDAAQGEAALKTKAKAARETSRTNRARLQIAKGQLSVAQQRANSYDAKQAATGKAKMSPAQRNLSVHTRDDIEYTKRQIEQLINHKQPVKVKDKNGKWVNKVDKNGKPVLAAAKLTPQQIRNALINGEGPLKSVSEDIYNAALDLHAKGYLSQENVRRLHRRGVAIGAMGYKTEGGRSRKRAKGKTKVKSDSGDILADTKRP